MIKCYAQRSRAWGNSGKRRARNIYRAEHYTQRNTPRWIFVEPARFERANGKKDLQGQAVKWREVDWGVRESQLTGCSAGETDEPPLERNSDDFSQEG